MITFQNGKVFKLSAAKDKTFAKLLEPLLIKGEDIVATFSAMRDGVVFTNKRIVAINIQGATGKKKNFSSLPYSTIQAYSVETAGWFETDSELEVWFSGLGSIVFEFTARTDVREICRVISECALC